MRYSAVLLVAAIAFTVSAEEKKGTKVTLGDISSTTPGTWVKEKAGRLRTAQFKLPKVGDDKEDAEIVVFAFGGGAKANIARWKGQFKGGTEGKVTEMKIAGSEAHRLEIDGTFTGTALRPGAKVEPKKGYRGVFYYLVGSDNHYQVRLVGPTKTVKHYEKGFDEFMKGFKK
jgi:hypothetical protein